MNRSAALLPRFLPTAVLVYAAALMVGAAAANPLISYAQEQAASYANDASHQAASAAVLLELQTAQVLDPGNPGYRQQLADYYVSQNDLGQAVAALGNTAPERLRKADLLIRLSRPSDALAAIQPLSSPEAAIARSTSLFRAGEGTSGCRSRTNPLKRHCIGPAGLMRSGRRQYGSDPASDSPGQQP